MPLLQNKFQPYFPDPDAPALENCGDAYCHPISLGDEIFSQFYQTPCAPNEIEDPDFADYSLGTEKLNNPSFTGNANNWITAGGALPSNGWAYDSNNIRHTPSTQLSVYQTSLAAALTAGYYQISIDITRTSGSVRVRMGDGSGQTLTDYFAETGSYTVNVYYGDTLDQIVAIDVNPDDDFDGTINSISVKEITYNKWTPTIGWSLNDGYACHSSGSTGTLEQSVADYINVNSYYELNLTVTGYVAGTCGVYIANVLVGTISANGTFYYYGTPTATGVVSFVPDTDFIGCINFQPFGSEDYDPGLFELKNDHLAYVVDDEGTEYPIGEYFQYYQRYVTLIFDISELELQYGCYTIKVVDACIVEGINLAYNGDFSHGSDDWYAASHQIQYPSSQMEFIFQPDNGTDLTTNGDFPLGDFTGWTAGANWSVVANKAVHTPGSTATLSQSITLPVPPGNAYQYWVWIEVTGRTAGSFTVQVADKTLTTFNSNMQHIRYAKPVNTGVQSFVITPTSDFDGEIGNIQVFYTPPSVGLWNSAPSNTNTSNPAMVAGNYEIVFDIVSLTSGCQVGARLLGPAGFTYFNSTGTKTITVNNYVPGGQAVQFAGIFETGLNGIAGTAIIDNVIVRAIEPFEATYTSECLYYALEHEGTKLLTAYCDQPAMGFEFVNTGFVFQQRVECRSLAPTYPQELGIQKSGTGNARITYSALEKYWLFGTGFLSETAHDSIACMRLMDHFIIGVAQDNGIEYIIEAEEYAPEWRGEGDYNLSTVAFRLRVKSQGQKFNRHT